VIACGKLSQLKRNKASVTGRCLKEKRKYPSRLKRRPVKKTLNSSALETCNNTDAFLRLEGAKVNNLQNLSLDIPLNRLVVVTGVSGSGKSTLVRECLLPALQRKINSQESKSGSVKLSGAEHIKAVYEVDQSPIGRTPRSTPATYVGFFDSIRRLFSQTPEARLRGYSLSRFSFNSAQGRCPDCSGMGVVKLEMSFLRPAYVKCETCQGARYNQGTLDIVFQEKTISEVLDLSVREARDFFSAHKRIAQPLEALCETGLDYLKLGQTSPTLSGGEAQRVKLVSHLLTGIKGSMAKSAPSKKTDRGNSPVKQQSPTSFFILEEPTIGLHIADVKRLVGVLQRLVDGGHTVMVIEHNLDVIAEADWVIDLGPEGGEKGGKIIAQGPPEKIANSKRSYTGQYLSSIL